MVADIVLAEISGQGWLVRGEQHIDDLLNNTLDPDLSIEVVTCESKSVVDDLWAQWNDTDFQNAWMIHPAIVNRARGKPGETVIIFAPWSASLDTTAKRAIQSAADLVKARGGALTLAPYLAEGAPAMAAQMAELRCGMIEAELTALGMTPPARTMRVAEKDGEADRVMLIMPK